MKLSLSNRLYRVTWNAAWWLFFQTSPNVFFVWRVALLKLFGADLKWTSRIYPKTKIWQPNNLKLGSHACLANNVNVYNVAYVEIGDKTVISQGSELITATKSFSDGDRNLKAYEIIIGENCWIASGVFIAPGVVVGDSSVVLAKVNLLENVPDNKIVKPLKNYSVEERIQ